MVPLRGDPECHRAAGLQRRPRLAVVFRAAVLRAGAFFAVVFLAVDLVAAVLRVAFFAVVFFAAARLAPATLPVATERVPEPAARVVFLAAFFAVVFFAVDLEAGEAAVFFAVDARGIFRFPVTSSLKPVPGRNAGITVFLTFTASPVRGLRAMRAARWRFSKTPNPAKET